MTHYTKEDVQAAIAAVVERAAEIADKQEARAKQSADAADDEIQSDWDGGVLFGTEIGARVIAREIRALAPADGLAAVEALRKERDHWETVAIARYTNRIKAEAERDRLAAELAAAKQREAALVEALTPFAFFDEEGEDTQHAWEIRYRDRFQDWIDFADIEEARAALAEVQARDDASTPPDTWHERRTMLPDGDARKEGG